MAIIEAGSLTGAAKSLGRSLPAMVRVLSQLEEELGVVLVRRTTRRMSMTAEGREYLARAKKILADVAEAEEAVGREQGVLKGPLTMTAPARFGELHVAGLVAEFAGLHPQVDVDLVLLNRVVNLVEEGIDLALRIGELSDSNLIALNLGSMRRVVVGSPELVSRSKPLKTPAGLAKAECVVLGPLGGRAWRFRVDGKLAPVPVRGRLRTNHVGAALKACVAGLGYGYFLAYQLQDLVREGKLVMLLEEFEPPPVPVSLVFADGRLTSPRLRGLIDFLRPRLAAGLERGL